MPGFHSGDINYRLRTSKSGMLKFYGHFNNSRVGLRRPDIDSLNLKNAFGLKNTNYYANFSWKEKLAEKWRMNLGLAFSTNTDEIDNQLQNNANRKEKLASYPFVGKNFYIKSIAGLAVVKALFERKLQGLSAFRFGGEFFLSGDKSYFSNDSIRNPLTVIDDRLTVGFSEADIYITNDLAAKIGSRVEHSSLLNKANVAPRVSLAYNLAEA